MRPAMKFGFAAIAAVTLAFTACTKKEEAPVAPEAPPAVTAPAPGDAPEQVAPAPQGEPSSSLNKGDGSLGRASKKAGRGVML